MIFYTLFLSAFLQAVTSEIPCPAKNPLEICRLKISRSLIPNTEFQMASTCKRLKRYYDCVAAHKIPSYELCGWSLVLNRAEDILMSYCRDPRVMWPEPAYVESFYCFRIITDRYSKVCKSAAEFLYDIYVNSSPKKEKLITKKNNVEDCAKGIIESECYTFYVTQYCSHIGILIFHEISSLSHFYHAFCETGEQYLNLRQALNVLKKEHDDSKRFWTV